MQITETNNKSTLMKSTSLLVFLMVSSLLLYAQKESEENNVVLTKVTRTYKFVVGNNENPVQIKEESNWLYTCTNYRSSADFTEFYNDTEIIDDIDILIDKSKKHAVKPKYDYYDADGLFFSDARICYFSLPLPKKGATGEVNLKKSYLDPKYFTKISFMDIIPVQEQEIKIIVPSWMKLELKEFNFKNYNIKKTVSNSGDETIYNFFIKNLPALQSERAAPGNSYYAPHLLVLCKTATAKDVTYTYFNTLKDQYKWYHQLILQTGNDVKIIKEKAFEITKGVNTEEERVKKIFLWVQDNIRYIAFENGIAGFKPESAQEVMRKKYGDCKGMANLVTELLKSLGIDARRCWIGTRHIVYDYSTPSLSVDNHMIAAWMNKGKPVFLDATEKYIGLGEIAERIQGRQTLIENGSDFVLDSVPFATYLQNTSTEKRVLVMEGTNLKGHVSHTWKGENKEFMLSGLNEMKHDKQDGALKKYLAEDNQRFEISNLKTTDLSDYNKDLNAEYDMQWKAAITFFDKEGYLDIDNRRSFSKFKIDSTKRKLPYWFSFKDHQLFTTEIKLPAGMECNSLPAKMNIQKPAYDFTGSYRLTDGTLFYKCEIIIKKTELDPANFSEWNADIDTLNNFYNQQIVFTSKN